MKMTRELRVPIDVNNSCDYIMISYQQRESTTQNLWILSLILWIFFPWNKKQGYLTCIFWTDASNIDSEDVNRFTERTHFLERRRGRVDWDALLWYRMSRVQSRTSLDSDWIMQTFYGSRKKKVYAVPKIQNLVGLSAKRLSETYTYIYCETLIICGINCDGLLRKENWCYLILAFSQF